MNYKECKEKLKRYSLARIPFIPFYTIERQRALDILRETAKDLSLPFYVHTLSKGMYDIVTEKSVNDDKTVIGALDFIAEQINLKANLTFIFTDVSELDADTTTARYIFDIVNLAEEKGASIIVITQDTVWSNLQRLGMSLDLDLPSEDEVYDIIAENIEPYKNSIKVDWDENDYREAALTLTGITKVEIQNVIVSLIASRHIKKADLLELKFAKDKLFSDINGLEKIEVSSDIADVGGLGGLKNWLNDNIMEINKEILDYGEEHENSKGLGTTVVAAIVTKEFLIFANIGDSSGYVMKSGKLHKVTKPHTLVNLLLDAGNITEEEAKNHPKKNVLMKALGAAEKAEPDIFDVDNESTEILLCSDGLTSMLSDDQIEKVLLEEELTVEEKVIKLIKKCNARGGTDNISIAYLIRERADLL